MFFHEKRFFWQQTLEFRFHGLRHVTGDDPHDGRPILRSQLHLAMISKARKNHLHSLESVRAHFPNPLKFSYISLLDIVGKLALCFNGKQVPQSANFSEQFRWPKVAIEIVCSKCEGGVPRIRYGALS